MKTRRLSCLLAAVLCALLAGCGTKGGEPAPAPSPEPPSGPVVSAQDAAEPSDAAPEPAAPEPSTTPEPEEPRDVQPEEPVLPEADGTDDISVSYVGAWRNDSPGSMSNGRCSMRIDCEDGVNYDISIFWGSSVSTARYWWLTGTYDETQGGIVYTGIQFYGWTQDDGSIERSEETEDEVGLIRLEDGVLYWEDATGYLGEEMNFNKES